MADEWFYAKDGQQAGPVTALQLRQLAAVGQLGASDLVWKQGMAKWIAAGEIKGLLTGSVEARASAAGTQPAPAPVIAAESRSGVKLADEPAQATAGKQQLLAYLPMAVSVTKGLCWAACFIYAWIVWSGHQDRAVTDDSAIRSAAQAGIGCLKLIGAYILTRAVTSILTLVEERIDAGRHA